MIIDAHAHLWKKQNGIVNGKPVYGIGGGKSDFGGEIRQMMPAYMTDGENNVERFLANMDYAGVSGAVITQEYIDGNQDGYLLECKSDRIKICALYEEKEMGDISGFDGIKICASRLKDKNLLRLAKLEAAVIAKYYGIEPIFEMGDVNQNNELDSMDVMLIKRAYFGTYNLTEDQKKLADMNQNGKIDSMDYILAKRKYFSIFSVVAP